MKQDGNMHFYHLPHTHTQCKTVCPPFVWSEWSPCSKACGQGRRYRKAIYDFVCQASDKCPLNRIEESICDVPCKFDPNKYGGPGMVQKLSFCLSVSLSFRLSPFIPCSPVHSSQEGRGWEKEKEGEGDRRKKWRRERGRGGVRKEGERKGKK